jgi:hypothetical protein
LPPGSEFGTLPPDMTPEQKANAAFARRHRAQSALFYYNANRGLTNFSFYLATAQGEQQKDTIEARKLLWKADQARRVGNNVQAANLYKRGLDLWRTVLVRNPDFHRTERLSKTEEDTYEYELEYLRLIAVHDPLHEVWKKAIEDYAGVYEKTAQAARAVIPFVAAAPRPQSIPQQMRDSWYADTAEKYFSPFAGNITSGERGVPPGDPRIDTPWIQGHVRESVRQRQGISKASPAPSAVPADQLPPPPPPPSPRGPG